MKLNLVLVEPEIPQNTGNIARTCAITGAKLHLVEPLGFKISDKYLKRAGLDYWDKLDIEVHSSLEEFFIKYPIKDKNMFYATTKGQHCYSKVEYTKYDEIYILFGKETKGLPESLLKENLENTIRIPMGEGFRSLNLSNSVAIVAYEVFRQFDFSNFKETSDYFEI